MSARQADDVNERLPTLVEFYDGLCQRVRGVHADWDDVGHVWSQGIVFASFVQLAPPGVCHTYERPSKLAKSKHLDLVWTRGDSFLDRHAELLLVLESQWRHQRAAVDTWREVVYGDVDKILAENVPIAALVTGRNKGANEELLLLGEKVKRYRGPRQSVLIVMFSPPQGRAVSCMARALAFEPGQSDPVPLGPTEC